MKYNEYIYILVCESQSLIRNGKRCMVDNSGSQLHWKDVPADTSNDGITLIEEVLFFVPC